MAKTLKSGEYPFIAFFMRYSLRSRCRDAFQASVWKMAHFVKIHNMASHQNEAFNEMTKFRPVALMPEE
jgi:hypothetical protein